MKRQGSIYPSIFWWIRQAALIGLACFFVFFGIHLLIATYGLKDPFSFILTFFASSYIILISATLIIVFIYRIKKALKPQSLNKRPSAPDPLTHPDASDNPGH